MAKTKIQSTQMQKQILAVNINKTISKLPIQDAIQQAWKLKPLNAQNCKYVIGIDNNIVQGYFRKINVLPSSQPGRVEFDLVRCNRQDWVKINNLIIANNVNLRGFVTKYI